MPDQADVKDRTDVQNEPAASGKEQQATAPKTGAENSAPPKTYTAEELEKVLQERLAGEQERLNREWQSKKDREVAQAKREALQAKKALAIVQAKHGDDPEVNAEIAQADKDAELDGYRQRDRETQRRVQEVQAYSQSIAEIKETVELMGVDPTHKALNEAFAKAQPGNLPAIRAAVLGAAKKIAEEQMESKLLKSQKDFEAEIYKKLGLESRDNAGNSIPKGRGRKPTVDELRAVSAEEWDKKIKSGEWVG